MNVKRGLRRRDALVAEAGQRRDQRAAQRLRHRARGVGLARVAAQADTTCGPGAYHDIVEFDHEMADHAGNHCSLPECAAERVSAQPRRPLLSRAAAEPTRPGQRSASRLAVQLDRAEPRAQYAERGSAEKGLGQSKKAGGWDASVGLSRRGSPEFGDLNEPQGRFFGFTAISPGCGADAPMTHAHCCMSAGGQPLTLVSSHPGPWYQRMTPAAFRRRATVPSSALLARTIVWPMPARASRAGRRRRSRFAARARRDGRPPAAGKADPLRALGVHVAEEAATAPGATRR